jgi:hypothetical protein
MERTPKISPRVTLRLPDLELQKLRLMASTQGLSVSEVVRQLIDVKSDGLHKKVRAKAKRNSIDAGVVRDIARAGNNLNRIAVALTHIGFRRREPSLPLVSAELFSIRSLLADVREKL